jgi:uncharacterized protein (TIGR01777 family)
MKHILIAGGTGLIGRKLTSFLEEKGHTVSLLSRNPKGENQFLWNPAGKSIDEKCLAKVEVLINLSGAGIADKRWTAARKKELVDSRIGTNEFLVSLTPKMPCLQQFITSSGINCYGYEENDVKHKETDAFGSDWLSQLVEGWEKSADGFPEKIKVAKIRTAVVLDADGGALKRMLPAVKMGIGSALGSGKQLMPWIHITDLIGIFGHVIENELNGSFNAVADAETNHDFMKTLAKVYNKPFWFPAVPSLMMRLLFGEMASVLLLGLDASNEKIKTSGFLFKHESLESALKSLL